MSKQTTELSLDELKQAFDSFDTDRNGSLSPENECSALSRNEPKHWRYKVHLHFNRT